MSNLQDWYLYMQMVSNELYRVDISKLVCEKSRPPLEGPQKYEGERNGRYVIRQMLKNSVTNTVLQLEMPHYISNTIFSWKVVTTIDSKIFVLVITLVCADEHVDNYWEDSRTIIRVVFQVYDPFHGLWKILPNPPICDTKQFDDSYGHFEWGHMLGVFYRRSYNGHPSYVFDTIEEKWMPAVGLPHLECAVEVSGFLIGVELRDRNSRSIVAYKLDEVGLPDPNSKHTLDNELWELFYPPLTGNSETAFLTRFGDDQVLFLSTADLSSKTIIVVAVFRVSSSTVCGIPVVNAVFEQKQLYEVAGESSSISSNFLMQDAASYGTRIPIRSMPPIMLDDDQPLYVLPHDTHHHAPPKQIDNTAPPSEAQTFENKLIADVEWDAGLLEKSMYLCFVENQTDCSVSYIIKAIKFSDLISASSHDSNSKLHQVASTSGLHLACLPCCGVFGSQILFAGGSDQDDLRVVQQYLDDDYYSEQEYLLEEVAQQVPNSRNIHFYDVTSNDPRCHGNMKRFTKCFIGMKPQPVLAEVEGKLYALAGIPKPKYINPGPFFEVFDPVEKEWSPLPDPPLYTKFGSSSNSHAVAGSNILAWGNASPGVFRFDMAADSIDKHWRLIKNSRAFGVGYHTIYDREHNSNIVVSSNSNGGGDFVLFTHKNSSWGSSDLQVHLISREFDYVVSLPSLKLPESVSSFLKAQRCSSTGHSSFAYLGGRRVCMVLSFPFRGPYSRNVYQLGEVDKMSIVILVFEFEVTENRDSLAAEFVFQRILEYDTDDSHATRHSKTSDAHMVGAFLL